MNKVAEIIDTFIRTDTKDAMTTVSKAYQSITAASFHANQDDESDVVVSMIEETQDLIGKLEDTVYNAIADISTLEADTTNVLGVLENLVNDFGLKLFIIKTEAISQVGLWLDAQNIAASVSDLGANRYVVFIPREYQLLFKMRWAETHMG